MLNKDGYPTEEALQKIKNWKIEKWEDCVALLRFVESIWAYREFGFHRYVRYEKKKYGNASSYKQYVYNISTSGWSGNESIMDELQDHFVFWGMCYQQHRIGGHYRFIVEQLEFHND